MDDSILQRVSEQFGTPTYVYFTSQIERRIEELRSAFGHRVALSYAVKSNPNVGLLEWLSRRVDYLDVSSIGELRLAREAGWEPSLISFTGPGKREFELREAIQCGVGELVVESVREAVLADNIAEAEGRKQNIIVRLSPDRVPKGFGDYMAGRPVAFGIDVEDIDQELPRILALRHLRLIGFHIFSGTQCLKADAIGDNYDIFAEIFTNTCQQYDIAPRKLIFGAGMGVPYHSGDEPLDLGAVAERAHASLDGLARQARFAATEFVWELGRYLVAEAGFFLTRVVSIKSSRGARIGVCDGGMNNHLAASGHFGMVVHRPYVMHRVGGGTEIETVDLVGPLCTSIDRLGRGLKLAKLQEGDLIAVHNSGAYGITASPIHFISHPPPKEILVVEDRLIDVSRCWMGQRQDCSHEKG